MDKINYSVWDSVKDLDITGLINLLNNKPGHYSDYSSLWGYLQYSEQPKREVFERLYNHFKIDFKGKSVCDIGPGSGESLDVARDMGAASTVFIDRDAIISRYCQLRGHQLIFSDYLQDVINGTAIKKSGSFDVVICKGAINADFWNLEHPEILPKLISWIDYMCAGVSVITPTWNQGEAVNGRHHTCVGQHFEDHKVSAFHNGLIKIGYAAHFIDYSNDTERFPITYFRSR